MGNSIKNIIKPLFYDLKSKYSFYLKDKAFKNRYKNVESVLFNKGIDKSDLILYKDKWRVLGLPVETNTFHLCYNLSGVVDLNIVPENIFSAIIEPKLNLYKDKQLSFLSTKNIYDKWFVNGSNNVFPKSYFHKIDSVFYDQNLILIKDINIFLEKKCFSFPLICKPSIDTLGGQGVIVINNIQEIKDSLKSNRNLVFQEKIIQNEYLEAINPGINSIRTCLYRTLSGEFVILNNSIRFGVDGSLDNLSAGGIVCFIKDNGQLNDYAVSKYCKKHEYHPNSKVCFSDITIPNFDSLNEQALIIANKIPMCNLVSLDMCLDINGKWRCLEINLNGQTIRFSQYAGEGFFNYYTDEVINRMLEK